MLTWVLSFLRLSPLKFYIFNKDFIEVSTFKNILEDSGIIGSYGK